MNHGMAAKLEELFVVTVISNPCRYERRYKLYHRFAEMCRHAGVNLLTVELGFGNRHFEVTHADNRLHVQIRSHEEFWHKENLINIGIDYGRRLWPEAKCVAWIDADCRPARPYRDWFEETWHELQHYEFVQMWEWFQPLNTNYCPIDGPSPSFMANYIKFGTPYPKSEPGYPKRWGSPGLAWAANLEALDRIGGRGTYLPDRAILGAGDWYLAHMLISDLPLRDMSKNYSPGYKNYWARIQTLCDRYIKRDVGFVRGLVYHDYHGKIVNRGYNTRERILIDNQYDPDTDVKYDHQGMLRMETHDLRQIRMYDQIRAYFRARNEDEPSY